MNILGQICWRNKTRVVECGNWNTCDGGKVGASATAVFQRRDLFYFESLLWKNCRDKKSSCYPPVWFFFT